MATYEYISDGLTLSIVQSALDRVKDRFAVEGCSLAIITEDRYQDAVDIIKDHFMPDNPIYNAFGVEWEENFEKYTRALLQKNLSVMMVSDADKSVMGVRISESIKKTDTFDLDEITYKPLRDAFMFLTHKDQEIAFFEQFGIDEAIHFALLGVHKDFRRRGLGTKLIQVCVALSTELGFKAIKVEAASNYSQRINDKEGFAVLLEMPYADYIYKGEPLRNKTGPHNMTKVMGKNL